MTITVTTVANNQSFGGWLATTNRLANIASQNTVTIDYTSGGSLSTGNGYVNGYFGANNIYVAAGLSGGNISSNGVLNIVSNTAFKYSSSNLVVLTANSTQSALAINVNTISFTGNANFINTISIGNSTVNSVINSTSLSSINSSSITANVIIANGSFGTANQVLSSNGTGMYWGDVAAGATFVRQTFTANSTVNTTFTITNGYTVNAIDVYENGIKLIVGTEVTANNGTSITLATSALNNSTVDVVGLLSASIFSLNINTVSQGFAFSWTNNHVFNANVDFYSSLTANTISVGNSTVNSVINSTSLTANAIIANGSITVGNSTVNSVINSTSLSTNTISVGNSTVNSVINSTSLSTNGSITVGNSTVNSVINSTSLSAAVIDLNTGANIASAATINLNTTTGNRVHITGTTTITAVTLTRGPRTVIFDGVLTLTHHTTNNNLPGAANITTAAGDRAIYESDGTTVFCVSYTKANFIAADPRFLIQLYA